METQGFESVESVEEIGGGIQPDRPAVQWDPFPQPRGWVMMCDEDEGGCCGHADGHLPHFGPDGQLA